MFDLEATVSVASQLAGLGLALWSSTGTSSAQPITSETIVLSDELKRWFSIGFVEIQ